MDCAVLAAEILAVWKGRKARGFYVEGGLCEGGLCKGVRLPQQEFFVNVYEMERLSGKTGVVNQKMCHISFLLGAGEWAL